MDFFNVQASSAGSMGYLYCYECFSLDIIFSIAHVAQRDILRCFFCLHNLADFELQSSFLSLETATVATFCALESPGYTKTSSVSTECSSCSNYVSVMVLIKGQLYVCLWSFSQANL